MKPEDLPVIVYDTPILRYVWTLDEEGFDELIEERRQIDAMGEPHWVQTASWCFKVNGSTPLLPEERLASALVRTWLVMAGGEK